MPTNKPAQPEKTMWRYNKWAHGHLPMISPVIVINETANFVTVKPRANERGSKVAKHGEYFDSFELAKAYVVSERQSAVSYHERELAAAIGKLNEAHAFEPVLTNPVTR